MDKAAVLPACGCRLRIGRREGAVEKPSTDDGSATRSKRRLPQHARKAKGVVNRTNMMDRMDKTSYAVY
jgi:hypothetical protein